VRRTIPASRRRTNRGDALAGTVAGLVAGILACAPATALAGAADLPRDGMVDVACTQVWQVPGETDLYLLGGLLVDAGWDREGNLCVVDYKNRDLKVFAADGRYLRTLGREGDGPGESRDARHLLLADDGRLGLLQSFPATVVWLHPDGTPGGRLVMQNNLSEVGGYVAVPHAVQTGSHILAYVTCLALVEGRIDEQHWLAPLGLDGRFGAPVFHQTVSQPERDSRNRIDEGDYYDLWAARWTPARDGGAWLAAERDRYLLTRRDRAGQVVQTIERPYTPVRRDDLGRAQALEHFGRKQFAREEVRLRDTAPVVRSLRLAQDGELWVELDLGGRGPAAGTIAWIDVWSPAGEWLRQLRLRGDYDPAEDQWRWVDDAHLLVLHAGADGDTNLRLLRVDGAAR